MSLSVDHIDVAFDQKRVLKDVSFSVETGSFVSLLGQSGAGKSTLLKTIAGTLMQDAGHIVINGKKVDDIPAHKRKTAILFQDIRLFPHMSAVENVAFPLKVRGEKKKEYLSRARELLRLVQLEECDDSLPNQLSGGQQQRVSLARALASEPDVLLLDEPFSSLDENLRDSMRQLVLEMHERFAMTTVLVTHDAVEALKMSDRIVYIQEGRVIQDAVPKELYESPQSVHVASCFGECSQIEGTVKDGSFLLGGIEIPTTCNDGAAVAVMRYEAFALELESTYTQRSVKSSPGADSREANPRQAIPRRAVPARVKEASYLGKGYALLVEMGNSEFTLKSSTERQVGEIVHLSLNDKGVFIYPLFEEHDNK